MRTATIVALENCLITSLTKVAMQAALAAEPQFSALFRSHLLSRAARIEEDLIDQLFNSSERRLARLLLLLANFGKDGEAGLVPVTLRSRSPGGNNRHHTVSGQLFHEQVPEKRLDQL